MSCNECEYTINQAPDDIDESTQHCTVPESVEEFCGSEYDISKSDCAEVFDDDAEQKAVFESFFDIEYDEEIFEEWLEKVSKDSFDIPDDSPADDFVYIPIYDSSDETLKTSDRYKFYEIFLCESISLRFTVSITKSKLKIYQKFDGYYNNARFSFYSTELKKTIGTPWRTSYPPNKKEWLATDGKPTPKMPTSNLIKKAISILLEKNAGISPVQTKATKIGKKEVDLFKNQELFVFWLTHYEDIATLDLSSRSDEDRHKAFAKVCNYIGSFQLSSLCTYAYKELDKACDELASRLKKALQVEKSTSNTRDKMQIIRYAITLYLIKKGFNPKPVIERLMTLSIPKKSPTAKIADNMRPQSLPIEHYGKLYKALERDASDISKGLQLMIFLGLTKEEVCGLNVGDVQTITGYYDAIHLCIGRLYYQDAERLILAYSESDLSFRFVPIPYPINKLLPHPNTAGKGNDLPLFTDESGDRLKPDELERKLKDLLKAESNELVVTIDGKTKKVDLAFLYTSYRASARFYWHYHCGLTEGEIRYLGGLTAADTLSGHYIDFNNANEQYRMLKQLEHGLALLTREAKESHCKFGVVSRKITEITAGKDTRAVMNLMINAPVKLHMSSWRGLRIVKEEDK